MKIRLALFASGSGSNVQRICEYFSGHDSIEVGSIYCNKPEAFVVQRAENLGIPCRLFDREDLNDGEVLAQLVADSIDCVILAGFLWLIPENLIDAYPGHIVNIHPALLPKYGGKGMYGSKVHEAVIAAADEESGISIHFVNEVYDEGRIIFQATCPVLKEDTAETLADRIHALEHYHFPRIVEKLLTEN